MIDERGRLVVDGGYQCDRCKMRFADERALVKLEMTGEWLCADCFGKIAEDPEVIEELYPDFCHDYWQDYLKYWWDNISDVDRIGAIYDGFHAWRAFKRRRGQGDEVDDLDRSFRDSNGDWQDYVTAKLSE